MVVHATLTPLFLQHFSAAFPRVLSSPWTGRRPLKREHPFVNLLARLDLTPCRPRRDGLDSLSAFQHSGGLTLCRCRSLKGPV